MKNGTTTDQCLSYKSADGHRKNCPFKCDDGSSFKFTKINNFIEVCNGEDNIMKGLYNYGTV